MRVLACLVESLGASSTHAFGTKPGRIHYLFVYSFGLSGGTVYAAVHGLLLVGTPAAWSPVRYTSPSSLPQGQACQQFSFSVVNRNGSALLTLGDICQQGLTLVDANGTVLHRQPGNASCL